MRKLLLLFFALAFARSFAQNQDKENFQVSKQLDIFNKLYRDLDLYYVDSLNAKKNIEDAIYFMLNQLDPYTEYYPSDKTEDLKQMTTGKYGGIGSVISYRKSAKRCIIYNPLEGMPAALAGLRPGDVLMAQDGKDYGDCPDGKEGEYSNRVSASLRGVPGSRFMLTVKRYGVKKPITVTLVRKNIVTPDARFYKLLHDSIGYIEFSGFHENAGAELSAALTKLKNKGAKSFILDLRGNPGGLIGQAIKVVNLFIPRNKIVVTLKGKRAELGGTYKTTDSPVEPVAPLVVLTDFGTASAAEITSGCLQDYDRAVIVGSRTYGKGLVQQAQALPYNAMLKLTIGKYYIPSGRCIQAYSYKDGQPQHLPDSLAKVFHTADGRVVRDGGGITPDVLVKSDSLPSLLTYLAMSDALSDYCANYRNHHKTIAGPDKFSLTDKEYDDLQSFLKAEHFTYDNKSQEVLDLFKKVAKAEGYEPVIKQEIQAMEQKIKHNEAYDFRYWKKEVKRLVEMTLISSYYHHKGAAEYQLRDDKAMKSAIDILTNPKKYKAILKGTAERKHSKDKR